jgi:hypothetical protein
MKLNWRTAQQQPDTEKPITAILANRDGDCWFVTSIYVWRTGIGWRHERKSTPPPMPDFVWLPEDELMATIQPPPKEATP